eukprot:564500-Pleurochrysis_carterae.AAC.1
MAERGDPRQPAELPTSCAQPASVATAPIFATQLDSQPPALPAQPCPAEQRAAFVASAEMKDKLNRAAGARSIQPGCVHWVLTSWPEAIRHTKPYKAQLVAEMIRRDPT